MIDHVSIQVRDLHASATFYEAVLAPLGLNRFVDREATVGFGRKYPEFWLNSRPDAPPEPQNTGTHICLRAPDADAVTAFHAATLAGGGQCDGPPGPRKAEVTSYIGAFIRDLDGHKIEAVFFPKKAV